MQNKNFFILHVATVLGCLRAEFFLDVQINLIRERNNGSRNPTEPLIFHVPGTSCIFNERDTLVLFTMHCIITDISAEVCAL